MNRIAVEHSRTQQVIGPDAPVLDRPQVLLRWGEAVNRTAMQRVERRVGLRLFGHWFGYESTTTERNVETIQLSRANGIVSLTPPAPRGNIGLAGGGVLAIALLGGAIGALLMPTSPQATNGAPLLTTLPASRPIAMPSTPSTQRVIVQRVMLAAPAASPAAAAAASVPGTVAIDADTAPDNNLSLAKARAAALSSGEPAYWAEGSSSGVVVAGPERSDNGQMCRLVAVFTRVEGDRGSTQSTTQCRAGAAATKN